MNIMMIWLILLLVKIEALDGVCVDGSKSICECFNPSITTHSIECCGDEIIRMELTDWPIVYQKTNDTCTPSMGRSSCLDKVGNNLELNYEDRINIFNSCTGKKRCNVTVHSSGYMKIQFPVTCVPATKINTYIENPSTNFIIPYPDFYIAGNDYIGKEISYNCTAMSTNNSLGMEILYIRLGPKSCGKVKMYAKGLPTFGLDCTEYGVTIFVKLIERIGTEFSLEIKDVELEENEFIYLRLSANRSNINVNCHGNQKYTTETPNTPTTTIGEITVVTGMVDGDEDEIIPYVLFGGILAALILIILVCMCCCCCCLRKK